MAAQQQTPMSARLPPDVPSDPKGISDALGVYLRNFALWCRNGFAEQLRNNEALQGVMLRGYDTPAGENPKVWMLEASGAGQLALAPMALGSGKLGDPVPVGGGGDYLPLSGGVLSGGLSLGTRAVADPADCSQHIALFDDPAGYYGLSVSSGTTNIVSQGVAGVQCRGGITAINGTLSAPLGITYGNWGYGGNTIRLDYDYGNWGVPVIVNSANVVGSSSFLTLSFGDGTYTPIRAWALNGTQAVVYAWWSPSSAYTWHNGASDIRLKSKIKSAQKDALAAINALSVIECDLTYPAPGAQPHHWNWAIVADEELGATIPSAYIAAEEHTHAIIRELPVIAALVKAVQQLTARVAELEAR